MCEDCENPMKWRVDENGVLLVPQADIREFAPVIPGWDLYETNFNYFDADESVIAKTFLYRQDKPTFYVTQYIEDRNYGGPEEGGWGYAVRTIQPEFVLEVVGERKWAEHACRALNRLARKNGEAPGPYQWGTSGIVFTVDRWIGEDDNSNDPRPHYC
jgi:hypothetical protein